MQHVFVSLLPTGSVVFPHSTADIFEHGVLTITDEETNLVAETFPSSTWRFAKVIDEDGYTRFRFDAPKSVASVCAWCPDAMQKTTHAARAGYRVSHTICAACMRRLEKEQPF